MRSMTRSDVKIICSLLIINFLYGTMELFIIPFYVLEAEARGLPQSSVGAVVCLYALMLCAASLLASQPIQALGATRTMHLGTILAGGSTLTFATLVFVQSPTPFLVLSCVLSSLEGLGSAALFTASSTIIANQFSSDTSFLIGATETATLLGVAVGPAVSGGLYDLGGMMLPFAVLGSTILTATSISWCCMPVVIGQPQHVPWLTMGRQLIRSSETWFNTTVLVLSGWMWSGLDPYLELHVHQTMGVTPATLGLCYLMGAAGTMFSGPIFGRLGDRLQNTYPLMTVCLLLAAASLVVLSPARWTGVPRSRALLAVSLTMRDVGLTGAYVPVFSNLLRTATRVGLPDSLAAQALISGLLSAGYALGLGVGPLFGSVLIDAVGFPAAASAFGLLTAALALLTAAQAVRRWRQLRRPCSDEQQPLLSNGAPGSHS